MNVPTKSELFQHSQNRACEVVDFVEAVRQNLLALDKIDKGWEKRVATGFAGNIASGVDIEKITNLTSQEVVKKSGYSKEQEKIVEEMEKCIQNFVPQRCRKFVTEESKGDAALLDEYSLRTRVIQEKIDSIKNAQKKEDSLEAYLKEEGYSKEEIDRMMKEESVEKLKEQISHRFRQKRMALQRSLKERFERTRVGHNENPTIRLKEIKRDAAGEKQRLAELVFFTNMISGFLKIGDEEGNILGTNSEALKKELADSLFSSQDEASLSLINFDKVKDVGAKVKSPTKKSPDAGESRNLDVKTINEYLLEYD